MFMIIELFIWNLYTFVNQCHTNKFNKKGKYFFLKNTLKQQTQLGQIKGLLQFECHYWKLKEMSKKSEEILLKNKRMKFKPESPSS